MHAYKKIMLAAAMIIAAIPPTLLGKDRIDDVRYELLQQVENGDTGELKKMTLTELETLVRNIMPIEKIGSNHVKPSFETIIYKFTENNEIGSGYGFEVLTVVQGKNEADYSPKKIRLTYLSPSGIMYYHPIERSSWDRQ